MTRLIRSRRALLSCLTAVIMCGALGVTGAAVAQASPQKVAGAKAATRPQASSTFANWSMFEANPSHSAVSSETGISTATASSLKAGWTRKLGTSSFVSPAVATSRKLGKAVVYAAAQGTLRAYPAKGGSAIWTFNAGSGNGTFQASPAVFDGVVYDPSDTGIIYAINAATGKYLCSYSTGQQLQASPVVVSDPDGSGAVLYVGTDPLSGIGGEYAIYGPGNSHGGCALDWKYDNPAFDNWGTWSSPAYGKNAHGTPVLVFGSRDSDDSVYALNATTGALDWRYRTSTKQYLDVGAPPTISAPGKNGLADGAAYVTGKDKVVYAFNLTTGALIWTYKLVSTSAAAVSGSALVGGRLYVSSNDGVYALNAKTGKLVWHVLTSVFDASPAVTGPAGHQVLVIGDKAGRIYALNLATGKTVWTVRPTTAGIWASAAISQGRIYVVGNDGVLRTYAPAA